MPPGSFRIRRALARFCLLTTLWGAAAIASGQEEAVDALGFSRAPYLQLATPRSIRIVWRTLRPLEPGVRYGTEIDQLSASLEGAAIRVKRIARSRQELRDPSGHLQSGPQGTRQFEAVLDGLEPATIYYYALYDGEERLTPQDATYRFRTHPEAGRATDAFFWVVGDSGTGEERQSEVHEAMLTYTETIGRPIDFYLHLGDMAYEQGTDRQFQRHFFDMYETTLRQTVVWPAMGNHEGRTATGRFGIGPYFDAYLCPTRGEAGGVGSGNESYYSFDYGTIHFVVLNSFDVNRTDEGAMASWLKEDLAQVQAQWLVAFWHHPAYSKGTHDTDIEEDSIEMRSQIMPILESHGVDLVLTGHSHIYERSMLMDGAYETPTTADGVILDDGDGDPEGDGPYRKLPGLAPNQGTIQVVAGNGGTEVERMATMPVMKRVFVEHGSVLISLRENVLEGVMINFDGAVRDTFQLRKEPGIVARRVVHPRVLPPYVPPGDDLPRGYVALIAENATWAFFHAGAEDPPANWAAPDFPDADWARGEAGFGHDAAAHQTVLEQNPDERSRLYLRHVFTLPARTEKDQLGLCLRYDDAFIAYVNGKEIIRHGVGRGSGASATELAVHDVREKPEYFPLKAAAAYLTDGANVLAIEAHSHASANADFTLDPFLIEKLDSEKAEGEKPPLLVRTHLPVGALWRYSLEQSFEAGWELPGFDDGAWKQGRTPMGYGNRRIRTATSLDAMEGAMTRVRFRREFAISERADLDRLGLQVMWDDGFIAYVNGHEIGRAGVARGAGETALGFGKTGPPATRYFPLRAVKEHLKVGPNVIAIEGHNQAKDSSDYFMAPSIEMEWPASWQKIPQDFDNIIERRSQWDILVDAEPDAGWTTAEAGEGWASLPTPLGYGYRNLETELDRMRGRYRRVYLRKAFPLASEADRRDVGLIIGWDDAFIAYLNGEEILRVGVDSGRGAEATGVYNVGEANYGFFPLADASTAWRIGENRLAIEAHNHSLDSGDFVVDAALVRVVPSTKAVPMPNADAVTEIIAKQASWRYLAGAHPPAAWTQLEFDAASWPVGPAGFGYGDDDDATELSDMKDRYSAVYARQTFMLAEAERAQGLALGMRWDDAFIAYLNGHEIIRQNVGEGQGADAKDIQSVEVKRRYQAFPLAPFARYFRRGNNVIAIEGHNVKIDSSDFSLDPFLFEADWADGTP